METKMRNSRSVFLKQLHAAVERNLAISDPSPFQALKVGFVGRYDACRSCRPSAVMITSKIYMLDC